MTRTKVQLRDEPLFRAKRPREARGISLADLARRGLDRMLSVYGSRTDGQREEPAA